MSPGDKHVPRGGASVLELPDFLTLAQHTPTPQNSRRSFNCTNYIIKHPYRFIHGQSELNEHPNTLILIWHQAFNSTLTPYEPLKACKHPIIKIVASIGNSNNFIFIITQRHKRSILIRIRTAIASTKNAKNDHSVTSPGGS